MRKDDRELIFEFETVFRIIIPQQFCTIRRSPMVNIPAGCKKRVASFRTHIRTNVTETPLFVPQSHLSLTRAPTFYWRRETIGMKMDSCIQRVFLAALMGCQLCE